MKIKNINGYYRDNQGLVERKTIPVINGQPHSPFGANPPIYPTGDNQVSMIGWGDDNCVEYAAADAVASDGVFLLPADCDTAALNIIRNATSYSEAYGAMMDAGIRSTDADVFWLRYIDQCGEDRETCS